MRKRAYTIVIVGNGAEILRRFRLTHRALVGAIAGTVSLGTFGAGCAILLPPLAVAWLALHAKLEALEVRNKALEEERQRMEGLAAAVGDRLDQFEADALRLSAIAE